MNTEKSLYMFYAKNQMVFFTWKQELERKNTTYNLIEQFFFILVLLLQLLYKRNCHNDNVYRRMLVCVKADRGQQCWVHEDIMALCQDCEDIMNVVRIDFFYNEMQK